MVIKYRWFLLLGLCVWLAACGGPTLELPDQGDPAVQREEARIAKLTADRFEEHMGPPSQAPSCQVRLLREEGPTDYVVADCEAGEQAFISALKIDGETVVFPEDGSGYEASVRRMFPADVADAFLDNSESYYP